VPRGGHRRIPELVEGEGQGAAVLAPVLLWGAGLLQSSDPSLRFLCSVRRYRKAGENIALVVEQVAALLHQLPQPGPRPVEAPTTGSSGLIVDEGSSMATWWYAFIAGAILLVMSGLATLGKACSRR